MSKLLEKDHVKNHPWFANRSSRINQRRERILKHSQSISGDFSQKTNLNDIFSNADNYGLLNKSKKLPDLVRTAMEVSREALDQLDFPIRPTLEYERVRNVKSAGSSDDILSGTVVLLCTCKTKLGTKQTFEIPVTIHGGEVVPPSVIRFQGRDQVLAQSTVNSIVDRVSSYALEPIRKMFSPPMTKDERAVSTEVRNEIGYQAREGYGPISVCKRQSKKGFSDSDFYAPLDRDMKEEDEAESFEEYIIDRAEQLRDEEDMNPKEIIERIINELDTEDSRINPFKWERFISGVVNDLFGLGKKEVREDGIDVNMWASRQASMGTAVPPGYAKCKELMDKAQEEGLDTFPRSWIHVLRNYILEVVGTASQDQWMTHLVNDGYVINPYGSNRGREKTAQAEDKEDSDEELDKDLDKDLDKEIDELDEEVDEDDDKDLDDEELDEDIGEEALVYEGTKTPIEIGDAVKFEGTDKTIRGTIVEVDQELHKVIVKAKGYEYRVEIDDISPLNRTFKKMYSNTIIQLPPPGKRGQQLVDMYKRDVNIDNPWGAAWEGYDKDLHSGPQDKDPKKFEDLDKPVIEEKTAVSQRAKQFMLLSPEELWQKMDELYKKQMSDSENEAKYQKTLDAIDEVIESRDLYDAMNDFFDPEGEMSEFDDEMDYSDFKWGKKARWNSQMVDQLLEDYREYIPDAYQQIIMAPMGFPPSYAEEDESSSWWDENEDVLNEMQDEVDFVKENPEMGF